ncbi:manganese/iron ABC transporter ATP-binding protein [Rhodalgimonas zhirmunskyi]|uniref:Manganese/iron ABC transporter ATP-binding protein n=1 Tax=Rhodalgimonas zhirmunskyi TaxID=2964767 RepID=A0AAJ1UC04_9RHOB|nr:manganese/iron ABC transporter ATP-binding protein [Rhodoalgimonas zhirmunskyi]MDQ2093392.1 manganese/iron ABC transporter ATP-binding protein [Rhodoalgimonas zhirmunskyi]
MSNDGIRADGLTVTYRNGHTALRDASFVIPRGTITALVGVNGAGKSTLFKALMGFLPASAGTVEILGQPARAAMKEQAVAYVPQAEEVDWTFPVLVEDVVMMGRYGHMGFFRRPRASDHEAVTAALARVGMADFRDRQIGELSGGQRKRVFLARALAQDAQVILLDEPFTGVDVKTEEQIIALLRDLRAEGRVMLVATHNLGSVPEFCDRVVLVKGTVLAFGPTDEVFTPDNLREAFGGVLRHFLLEGQSLHDDEDDRRLEVFSDDERPLVIYDERTHRVKDGAKSGEPDGSDTAQDDRVKDAS